MDLSLVFAIAAICAAASWIIANQRGAKDAGMWAFAGFLLGPIGLLLTLIFAKPKAAL